MEFFWEITWRFLIFWMGVSVCVFVCVKVCEICECLRGRERAFVVSLCVFLCIWVCCVIEFMFEWRRYSHVCLCVFVFCVSVFYVWLNVYLSQGERDTCVRLVHWFVCFCLYVLVGDWKYVWVRVCNWICILQWNFSYGWIKMKELDCAL